MNIGILQCGHMDSSVAKRFGDFDDMFKSLLTEQGLSFQSFDVVHMNLPESVEVCDGWLLTGSKHGVYEDHPFISPLETFIRSAHAAQRPMVGICFGHQVIAQALGGRVEKFSGGWGLGRHSYVLEGLGQIALNTWHQDQVVEMPSGARTIGRSNFCMHAALAYGNHILTLQPHPEFSNALITEMVKTRRGTKDYPDDRMDQALTQTAKPVDQARLAQYLGDFFKRTQNG